MSRRNYTERSRAYRRRMQREADERRELLAELEQELHQEWAQSEAVQTDSTETVAAEPGEVIPPTLL